MSRINDCPACGEKFIQKNMIRNNSFVNTTFAWNVWFFSFNKIKIFSVWSKNQFLSKILEISGKYINLNLTRTKVTE